MPRIHVLVVFTTRDVEAEVVAERVNVRPDMLLVNGRSVSVAEADALIAELPRTAACAAVVVGAGQRPETDELARTWLAQRADLVLMLVDTVDDVVRVAVRDPRLDTLLNALRSLVERGHEETQERVVRVDFRSPELIEAGSVQPAPDIAEPPRRALLALSIRWLHAVLRDAVTQVPAEQGDMHGLSLTKGTLLRMLDTAPRDAADIPEGLRAIEQALDRELDEADPAREPLAAAYRVLALTPLEFRVLLLGLAPELDLRFQRCMGFLLDEMARRVGTLGLYSTLLGPAAEVRCELARTRALERWLVFEGGRHASADEPLKVDPFLARWLLGEPDALTSDARVGRVLRPSAWAGASLLGRHEERIKAGQLIDALRDPVITDWVLLDGDDAPGWRALLEAGATAEGVTLLRADLARLDGVEIAEIEDCAARLGRLARLLDRALIVDATCAEAANGDQAWVRAFFAILHDTGCRAAVIARGEARIVRLIGAARFALVDDEPLPKAARVEAVRAAAKAADTYLTEEAATQLANQYPLRIDGLEHAASLARGRPLDYSTDDPRLARFTAAAKEVAAEGISHLADLIEPAFRLEDVVLPPDRHAQLVEIADNVRLAPRVLDDWKFRDQLPYGSGVTALFVGMSGTGKTMAAIGIARRLGVQLLRLDLSRVVSKYIGDTEKNLDRVFADAERSGAAMLIDEADALLGKRSEVKDAHDRYANIEVAFLLQRMEAYRGLAILTTNMRQSLDPAFLRRLRFIVDFPRPDAEAREQIWRLCLPAGSHTLDDAAFRQLARRIDLTGGHIRQITLRAAFIAAAADVHINLAHIAQAARAELAKLGMPPVELETHGRHAA